MKKKQLTYALLGLVLLIWGVIVYRMVIYFGEGGEEKVVRKETQAVESVAVTEDSFSIVADYPDPFLGNSASGVMYNTPKSSVVATKKPKPKVKEKPVKEEIDWSFISYLGLIKNSVTGKMVALVNINGKELMAGEGDMREQVKFLRNTRDSIQIEFKATKKYVKRKMI